MKPGLKEGNTAGLEIIVDKSMFAAFGGVTVHELYSTATLVYHMEWVARKTIMPYLDESEEGMGCGITVEHLKPAAEGERVTLSARVTAVYDRKVDCFVEAFGADGLIAAGTVKQAIVQKQWLQKRIKDLSAVSSLKQHSRHSTQETKAT